MNKLFIILIFILSTVTNAAEYKKFDNFIKVMSEDVENFSNIEFYNNKTISCGDKIIKIKELDEDQINLFIVHRGQNISDVLYIIGGSLDKLDKKDKELTDISNEINALRKKHAIKFELVTEVRLSKIKNMSDYEKKSYLRKIKTWNDNHKLIERKK